MLLVVIIALCFLQCRNTDGRMARRALKNPCFTNPQRFSLVPVTETASLQHLRSAASHQLTVPSHRQVTYGGRAFAVAGPSTCNSLPKCLCDPSNSASVFGRFFKTFLFSEY